MPRELLSEFVSLWVVIDPVGTVPVYIAVTAGLGAAARRRVALRCVLASALVLTFFFVAGELLLELLEIPLTSFQIAGGVVLFLFALTMVFGPSKPECEKDLYGPLEPADPSIYPLAIPSLAGPGSMMSVVLLNSPERSLAERGATWGILLAVLLGTWALLRGANGVHRLIGDAGASVISRVMGLVLAALAADKVLSGLRDYFNLA